MSPGAGTRSASVGGVARGGAVNVIGSALSAVVGFALTVVITRALPQESAGVFFSTTSGFLVVVAVAQLGTNTGLVYFVSRTRALEQPQLVPEYLRTAAGPVLLGSLVLATGIFAAAPRIAAVISPDQVELATVAIRVLAPFVLAASVENLAVSATRGLGTMRPSAVITLVLRPLSQLLFVGAAVAVAGPGAAPAAWAAGYLLSAAVALRWARRLLGVGVLGPRGAARRDREFWRFTWPRGIMGVAQVAMQRLDIVLVGALAGAAPAAVYAAATRFVVAGQMGAQAVGLAAQPQFAHLLAVDEHEEAKSLYRVSTGWLVLMTWPLYLALAAFAGTMMRLFGTSYADGGRVVAVLAGAFMLGALFGMVDVLLVMSGRTTWTLVNSLVGLALLVGLDLWLVPRLGVLGAALGWAAAIVIRNLLGLIQVRLAMRLDPFGRTSFVAVAVTLVGVGAPLLAARAVLGDTVAGLAVGGTVGLVLYVGGALLMRDALNLPELVQALRSRRRGSRSA